MSDIPAEIQREILLHLPAYSLLRFRAVCKSWRRLIDSTSFLRSYTAAQISSTNLLLRNSTGTRLFSLTWDSLNFTNTYQTRTQTQTIDITPIKMLCGARIPRLPLLPVPDCNGLILIPNYQLRKNWVIWNPWTREYHEVPEPDTKVYLSTNGLGYDSADDDYKIVRIEYLYIDEDKVYRTYVYSLKQGCWRMIENCPRDIYMNSPGVYVNGALYWTSLDCLVAVDLTTEAFRLVSVPTRPSTSDGSVFVHLTVLDGFLAYSQWFDNHNFDVWVMKEDGVWRNVFSWRDFGCGFMLSNPRPVAYWEKKGKLLFQNNENFIWCDIVRARVMKVVLSGLGDSCFTSQILPWSFFRLNDSVEERQPRTKRRREDASTKLLKISAKVSKLSPITEEEEDDDYWNNCGLLDVPII